MFQRPLVFTNGIAKGNFEPNQKASKTVAIHLRLIGLPLENIAHL
jgi:hypothetical protein